MPTAKKLSPIDVTRASQKAALLGAGLAGYRAETHDFVDLEAYREGRRTLERAGLPSAMAPTIGQGLSYQIGTDSYAGVVADVTPAGARIRCSVEIGGTPDLAWAWWSPKLKAYKWRHGRISLAVRHRYLDPHF